MASRLSSLERADPSGVFAFDPIRLCIIGVPGSGKSTLSRRLAERFEVAYLHSSKIVLEAIPGYDPSTGLMAPEPETTLAIERAITVLNENNKGWILDGFPRTERQLRPVRFIPIVYLHVTYSEAMKRSIERARFSPETERYRLSEQSRLLAPLKGRAAVIVPTTRRTPQEVYLSTIAWLEREQQPWHLG